MTQNKNGTEDLRVRRTRLFLQNAFIELSIEKDFSSVTIADITERAMVNRSTFYRHFQDKYDLLDKYMDDLYHLLDLSETASPEPQGSPPIGLIQMMEHLQVRSDFYRSMLGPKGYPPFAEKIREYIERRIGRSLPTDISQQQQGQPPLGMILSSISNAAVGAIRWWLENGTPYTPLQMAIWSVQLSNAYLRFSSAENKVQSVEAKRMDLDKKAG